MKKSPFRFFKPVLSSFTLVELLVVIGIIAILASVILFAGSSAIRAAKRTKAANTATQIQAAALAYYTEYNVYPVPPGTTTDYVLTDISGSATAWANLICSLCGNIKPYDGTTFTANSATPTNSRGIAFLSLRSTDVDANNAPLNPLPTGNEIYFNIAMDSDYDGVLGTSPSAVTMPDFQPFNSTSGGTSTAGVAVWANCNSTAPTTSPNFYVHTY